MQQEVCFEEVNQTLNVISHVTKEVSFSSIQIILDRSIIKIFQGVQ